jgi:hypothetical protein
VILTMNSCGHAQASRPQSSMDDVMKGIHDYGRDHAGLPAPESSAKPTEDSDAYGAHIEVLLKQGDFAQLEKIAQQNRVEKGRLLGGIWKNFEFFTGTAYMSAPSSPSDADFQARMELLKKWIAAYPQSAVARISLAEIYTNYALLGRGPEFANAVTEQQWQLLHDRTEMALQVLRDAAALKERDPHWYYVMQLVAHNAGWSKTEAHELLEQAVAFEPGYYHFYRQYAQYLRPQWYGQPGDIQAFAEEASKPLPEPGSSIVYFQIVSSLACYCRPLEDDLRHINYPKARQGYKSLTELYGTDNLIANRFAFIATEFRDKASAHEAHTAIREMEPDIWQYQEIWDDSVEWANRPEGASPAWIYAPENQAPAQQ